MRSVAACALAAAALAFAATGCARSSAPSTTPSPPPPTPPTPAPTAQESPFGAPVDPDALRGREERAREVPPDLDTRRLRPTRSGLYRVSLRSAVPEPGINRMHNWFVRVLDAGGRPVDGLKLDFDGGMPAHGHGFPTRPRVTRALGNGTYLVEGVKFNMSGWWEFVVRIDDGSHTDDVRFNLVVED